VEKRLAAQGLEVKWVEFPAGPQLLEGLNVGAIDFGYVGEAPPIFAQAAGANFVYVGYEEPAPTAEAVLVPKGSAIRSVADLKGRKVALNKGSNVHYLLVKLLEKNGLKYADVQPVFLPPADARAAFERGSVDAWVIWDPYTAAAEKQIEARILADGKGVVNNYAFFLAEREFASKRPEVISLLFEELQKQGQWINRNYPAAAAQLAPLQGLDPAVVEFEHPPLQQCREANHRSGAGRAAEARRHLLRTEADPQGDQGQGGGAARQALTTGATRSTCRDRH
jgi:sulfonate transport system substrate-binding protein